GFALGRFVFRFGEPGDTDKLDTQPGRATGAMRHPTDCVVVGGSKRRSATSRYPLQMKRHFAIRDTPAKRLAPAAEGKAAIWLFHTMECCTKFPTERPPEDANRGKAKPKSSRAGKQSLCHRGAQSSLQRPRHIQPREAVVEPRGGRDRSTAAQDDGVSSSEQPRRARLLRMRSADRQIQSRLRAVATGGHTAPSDQYPRCRNAGDARNSQRRE